MLFHHDCFKQLLSCLRNSQELVESVKFKVEKGDPIDEQFKSIFEEVIISTKGIKKEKETFERIAQEVSKKESKFESILHEIRFDLTGVKKDQDLVDKIKDFMVHTYDLADILDKIVYENTRMTQSQNQAIDDVPLVSIETLDVLIGWHKKAIDMIEKLRQESSEWAITFKDHKEEIEQKVHALEDELILSRELVKNFNSWV